MTPVYWLRLAALALCIGAGALAGCGGGGGGSIPHTSGAGTQSKLAEATLHIVVPEKTTDGKRRPAYISPSTTQLAWSIGSSPQPAVQLTTPSPCTSTGSGLSCTVNFYIAPGTYTFTFTCEDVNGNALSTATSTNYTLAAGSASTLSLTLGGIAANFSVTSSSNNFGTSGTLFAVYGGSAVTLAINAQDADANLIVGNGAPTITATLLPSPSPPATLTGSGSTFTLTSTYQSDSPTQPGSAVLQISASPYPGSGATSFSKTYQFLFYVPWIYVTNSAGNVLAYDELGTPQSPAPLVSGLPAPVAIAFGSSTSPPYLYVATVTTPTPIPSPVGSNTLGPNVGGIIAYNGDGSTPSPAPTPAFSGVGVPVGLAFDTNNSQLYVVNSSGTSLQAFSASGGTAVSSATISGPTGIVFDSNNNELYVSTSAGVVVYTETGTQDASKSFTGLSSAIGIAYDQTLDEIFVLSSGGIVTGYPAAGGAAVGTFTAAATSTAILYDPYQQWIYVIGSSGIKAYSTTPTLGTSQTLSGSWSNLGTPTALTVVQ